MLHRPFFRPKKKVCQKINILARILIVYLVILLPISQTFAKIDDETLKFYAKNNILYYDPTGYLNDCTSVSFSRPSGDQITWIGDSYSVAAKTEIEKKLPGVDFGTGDSNIKVGRTVSEGLSILSSIGKDNLRPYLVFALGTNGLWNDSQIAKISDPTSGLIDENTKVILVTSRTENGIDYTESNKRIKKTAENNKNIFVADWASDSVYKSEYYASDLEKIHPYSDGGLEAWANVIYNALPSSSVAGGSGGIVAGSDNAEKVWNYFATAGINNVSNRPEVIAAIVGNLYGESGLDPFAKAYDGESDYVYGLYQSYAYRSGYDPELGQKIDAAGLNKYWHKEGTKSTAPDEAISQAIKIELDHLTSSNDRFLGTGWAKNFGFLTHIDNIKSGTPEGFSDLFAIAVEGAVTSKTTDSQGMSNHIEDPDARAIGMASFGSQAGGGQYYQSAEKRRRFSRQFFDQFQGISGPAYTAGPSGNCNPVNSNPGDALSFLQQYVRDINYFYDAGAPMPTTSEYYKSGDPSTYTAPMPKASVLNKTNLNNSSLSQDTKNKILSFGNCFGGASCRECTALSGWFVTMFTKYTYKGGHGYAVVNNLVNAPENSGLTISSQPTPWSIFSYGSGDFSSYGHTGVVIDVLESGEIITIENNLGYNGGTNPKRALAIVKKTPDSTYSYTDLRNGLDLSHLGTTYGK